MYLLDSADKGERKWSVEQAWYLIKSLAEKGEIRYYEVVLSNTFASSLTCSNGGERVLQELAAAELISIGTGKNGRPQTVKASRPVYQAAFRILTKDHVLRARLDLSMIGELTKIETKCKFGTRNAIL